MSYLVYKHTNTTTGKSYIGVTKYSMEIRWKMHLKSAKRGTKTHFANAIRKYGQHVWKSTVIVEGVPQYMIASFEKYWIYYYNTFKVGYNQTLGGEGTLGFKRPMGKDSCWYGKTHTEETKKKISIAHTGKRLSPEHKKSISVTALRSNVVRVCSESTKKKLSIARKGKPGTPHTEAYKAYISECGKNRADKTMYRFTHKDFGEVLTYPAELARKFNLLNGDVNKVVRGVRSSTKGWRLAMLDQKAFDAMNAPKPTTGKKGL